MQGETNSTFSYNHLPSNYSMISFLGEPTIQEDDDDFGQRNKLPASLGVVVPVILSMFSVILFLRVGFVVGQAGLIYGSLMFVVAYLVVVITVLSISAIATNGVVKGGGAYYMISRTLGPEFGGAIGVIFFFANVFSSALYILGFVEALVNNFGPAGSLHQFSELQQTYEWKILYGTCALLVCCAICLVGAGLFAKTSLIIFLAVIVAVASSLVSFFVQHKMYVPPASDNPLSQKGNSSDYEYHYTSWSFKTAKKNLWCNYSKDYSSEQHEMLSPLIVFGVLFNGVTGIMAGVNMSGDLKNPGRAIPFGTLIACLITFIIYILLVIFTGFTCSRELLHNNFNYLQPINKVPQLVAVGVFAATLSAALSCLIGASRILHALAKDKLFGVVLQPFIKVYGRNNEPIPAVLLSWLFVQVVLFIGNVNKVAPLVSMFFLLCYGVTNLACFVLKVASAPNFRPTFKYFSWQTALFGSLFCFVIMFLIDPLYATISLATMIILFVVISLRAPVTPWGDVSQALIYHQVRKYLLRLDIRKEHVKFWRPQVLLLVSNPRSSYHLIDFVNDIKKSGMYMLGHIQVDEFNIDSVERQRRELVSWLNFVDCAEIKSFVEITIAPTIRQGAQNLLMTSGLGSMRANTVVLGFFDDTLPQDRLSCGIIKKSKFFGRRKGAQDNLFQKVMSHLPRLRMSNSDQKMDQKDYVGIIRDCITLGKNICITRNFEQLNKNNIVKGGHIDVWPVSASQVRDGPLGPYDLTFLLILQLSCILHMVPFWEANTSLRVFSVAGDNVADEEHTLIKLLKELRIPAEVRMIHILEEAPTRNASGLPPAMNWYRSMNHLIRTNSSEAYVVFTGLPHPPQEDSMSDLFLEELSALSENLPPVMMVYGRSPVVSTSL